MAAPVPLLSPAETAGQRIWLFVADDKQPADVLLLSSELECVCVYFFEWPITPFPPTPNSPFMSSSRQRGPEVSGR